MLLLPLNLTPIRHIVPYCISLICQRDIILDETNEGMNCGNSVSHKAMRIAQRRYHNSWLFNLNPYLHEICRAALSAMLGELR